MIGRRLRGAGALAAIVGLVATAAGIRATAASWSDSVNFAIEVSAATTTSAPTSASVSVTALCKNQNTFTLRVSNYSTSSLDFALEARGVVISGPHTIAAASSQIYELPNGSKEVRAAPVGNWINTNTDTASTPRETCAATTTTTPPPTPPNPGTSSGGITSDNADTIINAIAWDITTSRRVCTVVEVTGVDSTPRDWAVRVDLGVAPWYGTDPSTLVVSGSGTVTDLGDGVVRVTGTSNPGRFNSRTNNTPITDSQQAQLELCVNQAPIPLPGDPSWYTVSQVDGAQTDTSACVVVTVTTTRDDISTFPFFYGWEATVDLNQAAQRLVDAGRTPTSVTWDPKPNGANDYAVAPDTASPPAQLYTVTSGYDWALRAVGGGADSFTTTACVVAS